MIHAEIDQRSENLVYIRFSDPDEEFGNKPFIPVSSMEEARHRVRTRNKLYILETLTHWVNQRMHAQHRNYNTAKMVLHWISDVKKESLKKVCDFVEFRRPILEGFAPPADSRFYRDYEKRIVPILDFCCNHQEDINGTSSTQES